MGTNFMIAVSDRLLKKICNLFRYSFNQKVHILKIETTENTSTCVYVTHPLFGISPVFLKQISLIFNRKVCFIECLLSFVIYIFSCEECHLVCNRVQYEDDLLV